MNDPVFVIYPETYRIISQHLKDHLVAPGTDEYRRLVCIISSWEAALQTRGNRIEKVVVYNDNGMLRFVASELSGWDGRVAAHDGD